MADIGYTPPYWWNQAWEGAALQGQFGKSKFPYDAATYAGRSAEISGELSEAQLSQSYELQKQTESARESEAQTSLGIQQQQVNLQSEAQKKQMAMAPYQTAISGVGALGQASMGYGILKKSGMLDDIFGGGAKDLADPTKYTPGQTLTPSLQGAEDSPYELGQSLQSGYEAGQTGMGAGSLASGAGESEYELGQAASSGYEAIGSTLGMGAEAASQASMAVGTIAGSSALEGAIGGITADQTLAYVGQTIMDFVASLTVVCTELHRQGYISDEMQVADIEYGKRLNPFIYIGYRWWADPLVRKMKKSKRALKITAFISMPIVKALTHTINKNLPNSIVGSILLNTFKPVCYIIGFIRVLSSAVNWGVEYGW